MKKLIEICLLIGLISILIFELPEYHKKYLRYKVGSQVVRVMTMNQRYGGTGFHIKAPSGKVYIITNHHVCNEKNEKSMYVSEKDIYPGVIKKIIKMDKRMDLCLIEPLPNHSGLIVAKDEPVKGESFYVIGYPHLWGLAITQGDIITNMDGLEKGSVIHMTTSIVLPGNSGSPTVNFWGEVNGIADLAWEESNWGGIILLKDLNNFLKGY